MLMLTQEPPAFHNLIPAQQAAACREGAMVLRGCRSAGGTFDPQRMANRYERQADDLERLAGYLFHRL